MLAGAGLSWKSAQQKSVATSTTEAEFVSASKASDEILWLHRVLADAGSPQTTTPLYEDNRACRLLSENPVQPRARHIDLRVMSLRERVKAGTVRVIDCPTTHMAADPLTKNLPVAAFTTHRSTQLGTSPHNIVPPSRA